MARKISKIQVINLILLLSILNGNILSMQKSNLSMSQDVQQGLSKEMLNEKLRDILNRFPINRNDLGEAVKLILAGANVNEKNRYGRTVLMRAARWGHKDIVELLIGKNANVNEKDNGGETALIWAASAGYKDMVQLLIDNGANVIEKDNYGNTSLILAASNGHKDVVQLLIDNDANVNQRNKFGATALTLATRKGHEGIVQLLIPILHSQND